MATFHEILAALPNLSEGDKKTLLQKVVLELATIFPEQEIVILNDENQPVYYCVPGSQYHPWVSPDLRAEMEQRVANRGPELTWPALHAKLEKLAQEQDQARSASITALQNGD